MTSDDSDTEYDECPCCGQDVVNQEIVYSIGMEENYD